MPKTLVSVWLTSLVLCWVLPSPHNQSYASVYYVTPHSPNPACEDPKRQPCLTINEYAGMKYFDGDDNITLFFLNGEHNLNKSFVVHDKPSLEMVFSQFQDEEVILLLNKTSIVVLNVSSFQFIGIQLVGVNNYETVAIGHMQLVVVNRITCQSCNFNLYEIVEVFFEAYNGTFFYGTPIQTVVIRRSELQFSLIDVHLLRFSTFNLVIDSCFLINSFVSVYSSVVVEISVLNSSVISRDGGHPSSPTGIKVWASNNSNILIKDCFIVGNTYGVKVQQWDSANGVLVIDQCVIANNEKEGIFAGFSGGVINIMSTVLSGNKYKQLLVQVLGPAEINFTLFNSTVKGMSVPDLEYGVYIDFWYSDGREICVFANIIKSTIENSLNGITIDRPTYGRKCLCGLTVSETTITKCGNGIQFRYGSKENCSLSINIKDSFFSENNGVSLAVLNFDTKNSEIIAKNVTFFNNSNTLPNSGIIQVDQSSSLSIEDGCVFRANQGSSVFALSTNVKISGEVIFEDNESLQGGAVMLVSSLIRLQSVNKTNTHIVFKNNKAQFTGGGIYINDLEAIDLYTRTGCFYQVEGVTLDELTTGAVNIHMEFSGNTAKEGGMDIYGVTPTSLCDIGLENGSKVVSRDVRDLIFKTPSYISSISSDPKRVCLCDLDSQLMCANMSYIYYNTTRYPGEEFSLSVAVVGFEFGTVTASVYANLLPQANNANSTIGDDQYVRLVTYDKCRQLNFTVNSTNTHETIVLVSNDTLITEIVDSAVISSAISSLNEDNVIPFALLTVPVYIKVTLARNCPPGFIFTDAGKCECGEILKKISENCSIKDHIPYVDPGEGNWIAPDSDKLIIGRPCPYNYCRRRPGAIDLTNPDQQCDLERTGILCGGCPDNLSLAIGSSKCIVCNDYSYTLLFVAFAGLGIALVLLIKILDMTVTNGAINGLIFYANIVWAHQSVLFPPQSQTSEHLQVLKTFIAWLNLDLGIETCFIPGLNGNWAAWLQFAFSVYIWLIAGLIILVSHYSMRATRLFGNNSVAVLATLFLLSYAKLLFTFLLVLEFAFLEIYPDNVVQIAWAFDGNVAYLNREHSILFAVTIGIVLVIWLPYTLVLLFIQCLRWQSHHRCLRWVNRLAPFFDSYLGPLKDKHHYWIGLGLLVRLGLVLTSAAGTVLVPFASIAVLIVTVTILCLLVLNVYKKWQLSVLEGAFLINLVVFSSGSLVVELQDPGSKDTFACISLGITFVLFLAIVGYHVWKRLESLIRKRINIHHGYEDVNILIQPRRPQTLTQPRFRSSSKKRENCDLRESLLSDTEI